MKRQIRRGVFETNSSSTHSIAIMMKSDYDKWQNGDLYLYDGYGCKNDVDHPKCGKLYTREEVIGFLKNKKRYDGYDSDVLNAIDDYRLAAYECFYTAKNFYKDYLEGFYEEFTTPSGETVVATGEYGYDG